MEDKCLQDAYAKHNECFGCGPSNKKGLQIKSYVVGDVVKAAWHASEHHQAFPGMVSGGIIGTLLDCHSNWAAAYFLMQKSALNKPPCTVTAEYKISLKHPTPSNHTLHLVAWVDKITGNKAFIKAELVANDKCTAVCEGLFVAVRPGHPAYHRW